MVSLSANADSVVSSLKEAQRQVAYATSLALNETAKDVQSFTLTELLPQKFTLRSRGAPWQKPGTRFGFNIKFARKDDLVSVIGSQADWLKLQEEGGVKERNGLLAIPTTFWKPKSEVMDRKKKPRAIGRRGVDGNTPFVLTLKNGHKGIFVRSSDARLPIHELFALVPSARVKAALDYVKSGKQIVEKNFTRNFGFALTKALVTAK